MQKRGENRTHPQISKTWEPKCTQTFKCLLPIACISEDNCISPPYLFSNFISVLGTTGNNNNNVIDTSIKIDNSSITLNAILVQTRDFCPNSGGNCLHPIKHADMAKINYKIMKL
jgi:hypothetical protein